MGTQRYSPAVKARAIAEAVASGSFSEAERRTGIPNQTIGGWCSDGDPLTSALLRQAESKLASSLSTVIDECYAECGQQLAIALTRTRENLSIPKQSAGDLKANITSLAIVVDKLHLMRTGQSAHGRYSQHLTINATLGKDGQPDVAAILDSLARVVEAETLPESADAGA